MDSLDKYIKGCLVESNSIITLEYQKELLDNIFKCTENISKIYSEIEKIGEKDA